MRAKKFGKLAGGIYLRLQVYHIKLCASRAFWPVVYPSQRDDAMASVRHQVKAAKFPLHRDLAQSDEPF